MLLSINQKREMYDKGFVRFPGCIPPLMVREALRAINHNIITNGIPPDQLPKFHAQTFCPDLQSSPYITGLFNDTPLKAAAEAFLGAGKVPLAKGGQMALRFPGYADPPKVGGPHIDGMYSPTNGVTKGEIHHFSALAAVFLSDTSQPFSGNFSVWPGTHRVFGEHFRQHGPKTLLDGMPKVEMPEPEQVLAQPGDAVITHYTLAHSVAPNVSPNVRYAIFFRIWREGHKELGFDTMSNIWAEWPGMADVLPEAERELAKSLGAY